MPVNLSLRRLLCIRDIEQEQHRLSLESAVGQFNSIETEIAEARWRKDQGSMLISAGLVKGDVTDIQAGRIESETGRSVAASLELHKVSLARRINELREALREKQIEHRQTEILIDKALDADAIKSARNGQSLLDDWFRARQFSGVGNPMRGEGNDRSQDSEALSEIPLNPKDKSNR